MHDSDIRLRPPTADDEIALAALFEQPAVKRWWPVGDYESESGWVLELEGRLCGWLEYHEETYEWYPSVAFDIALDSSLHGRGYGRRAIRLGVEHFLARGHHRFTVDPSLENERAIRCYAAVGFARVGVLRAYERNPAGGWNDALLMDLVVLDGAGWPPTSS